MKELPPDIKAVLGDINEEQLRRFIVRLTPYILEYFDVSVPNGGGGAHVNMKWRRSHEYLNARDKELTND